jgi:adenylate kinase
MSNTPLPAPLTLVFFGISGAGKGTQVELLKRYLEERDPSRKVLHLNMGQALRDMMQLDTLFARKVRDIVNHGDLVPSFVTSYVVTDYFIQNYQEDEHVLIEGVPRRVAQASALDAELAFYGRPNYEIVNIALTEEAAKKRLSGRGRADDLAEDAVARRFAWYKDNVIPAFDLLKSRGRKVHDINGEPSVDEVQTALLKSIGLI